MADNGIPVIHRFVETGHEVSRLRAEIARHRAKLEGLESRLGVANQLHGELHTAVSAYSILDVATEASGASCRTKDDAREFVKRELDRREVAGRGSED